MSWSFCLGWVSPYLLVSPFSNGTRPFVFFFFTRKKGKKKKKMFLGKYNKFIF
jgi:hypothetical protein